MNLTMRFVEKFEVACVLGNNDIVGAGVFDSYEEANDAAILKASEELPKETVKFYTINKFYANDAFVKNDALT